MEALGAQPKGKHQAVPSFMDFSILLMATPRSNMIGMRRMAIKTMMRTPLIIFL